MEEIIINGGHRLTGSVRIDGAKNAVLPIMAAALLAGEGVNQIENVPLLADVLTMRLVLEALNVHTEFDKRDRVLMIDATGRLSEEAPFELVSKMRASIVVLGPLLARLGKAKVAMPGGCAIGSRPIDLHLKGLRQLGAKITQNNGFIEAEASKLIGAPIYLDFPSVGATENIMMAAVLAEGTTYIDNAAREPEIVDLAIFLTSMGAKITGAGTETIKIVGVSKLNGTIHPVVQDRIEAGTFMVAAAITQGNVLIKDAIAAHNRPLISKLLEMGVTIDELPEGIRVVGPEKLQPVNVKTMPHPGFPTDMQPQMTIAQLMADGTSLMNETVFENRFMHVNELRRMNAQIEIEGNTVLLHGPAELNGAPVEATDLRAAAALVLAGLVADGETRVSKLNYLDRGYYLLHQKLSQLGADIRRSDVAEDGAERPILNVVGNNVSAQN
ncbi:UDP-N-acetylglucosamine 1-carboxyvinyltransferase [Lapidilactobacillus dextrinicus DSM 20335]|uniref:UDP-N-acetylglucosamine 1-carboxyvinyltransferase n=2 Tax=Lapidilactobacillus dextrinicus TaxID=51664 RepID=A0A0R2BV38_9LACO|nr:UDP-N-acetylglucosamine 1-carboxyvinyltransferase [Lapidilactobacillus dextrinicus]KRM79862.1 UDP-N-acetylglucosamine 1-carboxyvinyltransferase [Lapidilactobacillus dextrinicus DSM 20335]QFG46354.1 UDP-N-acetylglucosamine 1-carboxyvinyltransferase [Lapidilactobacillus dextrinicus]